MTKLKMGIIGVGGIAQSRHIPSYQQLKEKVELVAVYDTNQTRAQEVAEKNHIPFVFSNYNDLFEEVDAVTICTPNKFHAEISIAALDAGVHVLCEKPMAMNARECELMIEAAEKSNKLLSIAYHYRWLESAMLAKKSSPEIGDPLVTRVQALRRRKVPGWGVFTNKELQGGGSLIDYGCHYLDLALWLLNDPEPVAVMGKTYNRLSKMPNQLNDWGTFDHQTFDVDDHVSAYITFENDISMLFECTWAANIKEDQVHLSISGTNGGMNVFPYEFYQPKHGAFMTTEASVKDNQKTAGYLQAKNFVESCLGEAALISKAAHAMKVTRIIDSIYQSNQCGSIVTL
ncbi:Gfo/Idh/MocA family protein [Oceanobacillus bengalensis]|uniref:Gfo/Idh/MocA family oxidoreductase n=1 Tax=Oceanobacillus bengalensis TaxID=1435466 RepID=A0A494YTW3_9BACI|nr:Gfo/Idh/MocA family oxidoreductase [Oceanobacillus bengalensis]RKQ13550.1 gfo/Idh/MocA family oxidoreductase [Oceanobacillus bengalensis]